MSAEDDDLLARLRSLPAGRFVDDEALWELATGELAPHAARRLEALLARDPELAGRFSVAQADLAAMLSSAVAAPSGVREPKDAPATTGPTFEEELQDEARRGATARLGLRFIHTLHPDQEPVAREALPVWVEAIARGGAAFPDAAGPLAWGGPSEGAALVRLMAEHLRRWLDALQRGEAAFDGPPQLSGGDARKLARMTGYRPGLLGGPRLARALGDLRTRLARPLRPGADPGRVVLAGSAADLADLRFLAEGLERLGFRASLAVEEEGGREDGLPTDEVGWEALLRPVELLVLVGRDGTLTRRLSELTLRFFASAEGEAILPVSLGQAAWRLPLPVRPALDLPSGDVGRLARRLAWIRLERGG